MDEISWRQEYLVPKKHGVLLTLKVNFEWELRARSHLTTTTYKIYVVSNIGNHATHFSLLSGMGAVPIHDDKDIDFVVVPT